MSTDAICGLKLRDGSQCQRPPVVADRCYWHAPVPKSDDTARQYFPGISGLRELLLANKTDLRNALFKGATLDSYDLSEANLERAVFVSSSLNAGNLARAMLAGANFTDVSLDAADLRAANLTKAGFTRCTLRRARLDGAMVRGTHLRECDLSYAILRNVDLRNSQFRFVRMDGADLTAVRFSDADRQMRYVNPEPVPDEVFFQDRLLAWLAEGPRADALEIIQFFKARLPPGDFSDWFRPAQVLLNRRVKRAWATGDLPGVLNLLEFWSRAHKITGFAPSLLALPPGPSTIPDDRERLILVASTRGSLLPFRELQALLRSLSSVLNATRRILPSLPAVRDVVHLSFGSDLIVVLSVAAGFSVVVVGALRKALTLVRDVQETVLRQHDIELKKGARRKQDLEIEVLKLQHEQLATDLARDLAQLAPADPAALQRLSQALLRQIQVVQQSRSIHTCSLEAGTERAILKAASHMTGRIASAPDVPSSLDSAE